MGSRWINLKSSLWFIPALSVLFAIGLAIVLVELDARLGFELTRFSPQFFGLGADGSRSILAAIAQSVIAIAGVSFSITIVTLSLAANQYSSRVLRNFIRDRGNQVVLGGLVGIFTYCILVLRTIQGGEKPFVPAFSVVLALAFSLVAIGLFVYFVHHVATSIQASCIVSSIAAETQHVIRRMFPVSNGLDHPETISHSQSSGHSVVASRTGYLQTLEIPDLLTIAESEGVSLEIVSPVGGFVIQGKPVLKGTWPREPSPRTVAKLQRCFNIQPNRTIEQDPAFGMRQIVDIAVKALSPGINDPTTAIICIDYLGAILNLIAGRQMPPRCRSHGLAGCVVVPATTFQSLVDLAFDEIRQNCQNQTVVYRALFAAVLTTTNGLQLPPDRSLVLQKHLTLIGAAARNNRLLQEDLDLLHQQEREVSAVLTRIEPGTIKPSLEKSR